MPRLSKIGAAALAAFGWTSGSTVSATYLQVAGGGGGGGDPRSGGGGAGGYLTGTTSLSLASSYTVIVGAGGANGINAVPYYGTSGSNSQFGALTASVGGGGGGGGGTFAYLNGFSGGSGGGAGGANGGAGTAGTGTSGQGNSGGTAVNGATASGGGGGGASAVGGNGSLGAGGNGGAGSSSSISGTSTTYAGGGGAGGQTTGGSGGSGGGGNGSTGVASSGTANTGGGGGGGDSGGRGGSGVVIISYASPQKFGGGIVTTSGSNVIHTFTTSGTLQPLSSLSASYLIVAGGGSGGQNGGAGGGAGGMQTGSGLTIDTNSNYLVTVGAGGAHTTSGVVGGSGANSSFSMITTASVGGGGAGTYNAISGANGGSGGGGGGASSGSSTGGTATSGQGNNGGTGSSYGGRNPAAGGGGAGAVGGNASTTSSVGGNGGVGLTSSISGTSTYYAGGGGGGADTSGSGGLGGGGAGATTGAGTSGTANTGGGGGGTFNNVAAGDGGSGVVIISYSGSTQQMAGGTVTISGGNVIHTFTSSGYLTPLKYVGNSLRFRSSASATLNRTASTPTNNLKWTWSAWVKKGQLSTYGSLFAAGSDASNYATLYQYNDNTLLFYQVSGGGVVGQISTTAVYRDPAAWYHIVVVYDSANATSANRLLIYVNGVLQTTTVTTALGSSQASFINSAIPQYIGRNGGGANNYFDGYLAEQNFIDGQALTPNSFGTFNSYGVWQPITYGGSYGTNGFYLPFSNKTSTTTLGYDFSPQGNNWTPNNISLTTGSTYDSMYDVPTLTSATVANYCVLNPLSNDSTNTLSNANLTYSIAANQSGYPTSTIQFNSDKYYWECTVTSTHNIIGIVLGTTGTTTTPFTTGYGYYAVTGNKYVNGTSSAYGSTFTTSDVIGVAVDMTALTITFYKNNTSQGAISIAAGLYKIAGGNGNSAAVASGSYNFGQQPFVYTPPTGYVALNTYNL